MSVGSVQITAVKAADLAYTSATAGYTLTISPAPPAAFTAMIGLATL